METALRAMEDVLAANQVIDRNRNRKTERYGSVIGNASEFNNDRKEYEIECKSGNTHRGIP